MVCSASLDMGSAPPRCYSIARFIASDDFLAATFELLGVAFLGLIWRGGLRDKRLLLADFWDL